MRRSEKNKETKKKRIRSIWGYAFYLITLFLIVWFKPFMFSLVIGESMAPTLKDKEILFFYKKEIKNDNITIFKSKWDKKTLIKRIVGVPGDVMKITDSQIIRNDEIIAEFNKVDGFKTVRFQIEDNKVFVLGDNIENSYDSLRRLILGYDDYLIDYDQILKTMDGK